MKDLVTHLDPRNHGGSIQLSEVVANEVNLLYRKRLEQGFLGWTPATTPPKGCERKMLLWVVWPEGLWWPSPPEPVIGWWKHGPGCFAFNEFENANHLVTHWCEISSPE